MEGSGMELAIVEEDGKGKGNVVKRGNIRRPVWLRTCWKYAEKLEGNQKNWMQNTQKDGNLDTHTVSGILEMSIYATLSFNLNILLRYYICMLICLYLNVSIY